MHVRNALPTALTLSFCQSVEINPHYTKGWGRLGTARLELGSWERAIIAFDHALSSLYESKRTHGDSEPQPLTPAEEKQEKNYENGIKQAREKLEQAKTAKKHVWSDGDEPMFPWQKANVLYEEMMAKDISERDMNSSVCKENNSCAITNCLVQDRSG